MTPFSKEQKAFSDEAHKTAQGNLYLKALKAIPGQLEFQSINFGESKEQTFMDGDLCIDRLIVRKGVQPIRYSVQERFRTLDHLIYQDDVTMTLRNNASDTPGELAKINADYLLTAYYDDQNKCFPVATLIRLITLKECIDHIGMRQQLNPKKNQTFGIFPLSELRRIGAVAWEGKDISADFN